MTNKQLLSEWKSKFYGKYSNIWGNNEKPISVWFKEYGFDLLPIRFLKRFHLDMNITQESFEQLLKSNRKSLFN